ncbi:peptide chain release factor N(5)-glutamine methyltransferase, partial [Campylobacter upsaliensis]|nr:peptide chain release factor N(5)-glutamine methyltransferase [Campylobacter upsaliensis]
CEFGYDQKEILSQILDTYNFKAEFFKDENGFDRAFVAKRT